MRMCEDTPYRWASVQGISQNVNMESERQQLAQERAEAADMLTKARLLSEQAKADLEAARNERTQTRLRIEKARRHAARYVQAMRRRSHLEALQILKALQPDVVDVVQRAIEILRRHVEPQTVAETVERLLAEAGANSRVLTSSGEEAAGDAERDPTLPSGGVKVVRSDGAEWVDREDYRETTVNTALQEMGS